MRELNVNEIQEVNGGSIAHNLVWLALGMVASEIRNDWSGAMSDLNAWSHSEAMVEWGHSWSSGGEPGPNAGFGTI